MNSSIPPHHSFQHHAMATWFEIRIADSEKDYAAQAARAAFAIIDALEELLSRYREGSEISQIRQLTEGESLRLSNRTFACLTLAREMQELTGGAFDPGLGACMDRMRMDTVTDPPDSNPGRGQLALHAETFSVFCEKGPVDLDLGAIGKGFALDQIAELFAEWEIERALLVAGGSSIRALHGPEPGLGWEVSLAGIHHLFMENAALGCSGTEVKGSHILDPHTGRPAAGPCRTWALADSAAVADALSTAWMLLDPDEIEWICQQRPETGAILQPSKDHPDRLITLHLQPRFALAPGPLSTPDITPVKNLFSHPAPIIG